MPHNTDDKGARSRPRPVDAELDDAYHEYLWGAESPRAFARRLRVTGRTTDSRKPQKRIIVVDPSVDPSDLVSR